MLAPPGTVCGPQQPGLYEFCFSDPLGYFSFNLTAAISGTNPWPAQSEAEGDLRFVVYDPQSNAGGPEIICNVLKINRGGVRVLFKW